MLANNNIQSILIEKFDKADPYTKEETIIASGAPNDINLSEILDRLIFSAGRFCQRYASDMFISWQYVLNTIKNGTEPRQVLMLATRRFGVDGDDFIMCNLDNMQRYAEVFLIDINRKSSPIEGFVDVTLKTAVGTSWFPAEKLKAAKDAQLKAAKEAQKKSKNS